MFTPIRLLLFLISFFCGTTITHTLGGVVKSFVVAKLPFIPPFFYSLLFVRLAEFRVPPFLGVMRFGFFFGVFVDAFKVGS